MKVEKIVVGSLAENCYLVSNEKKEAILIDPGDDAEDIIRFCNGYDVKEILITHYHFDHIGALDEIKKYFQLKENTFIKLFPYEVIATPGHTDDSISFYFPSLNAVFVGDFIFERGIGRCDLGGNEDDMKESLQKFLKRFKDDVVLYPGHGDSTTLGQERKFLQYFCL